MNDANAWTSERHEDHDKWDSGNDLVKGYLDLGVFLEWHLPNAIEFLYKL